MLGEKKKNKKDSFEILFGIVSFLSIHIIWIDICFTCSSVSVSVSSSCLPLSVSISFFAFFFRSPCLLVCYCVEAGDGTYSNVTEKRMDCARSTHSHTILMNRFPFTCSSIFGVGSGNDDNGDDR